VTNIVNFLNQKKCQIDVGFNVIPICFTGI